MNYIHGSTFFFSSFLHQARFPLLRSRLSLHSFSFFQRFPSWTEHPTGFRIQGSGLSPLRRFTTSGIKRLRANRARTGTFHGIQYGELFDQRAALAPRVRHYGWGLNPAGTCSVHKTLLAPVSGALYLWLSDWWWQNSCYLIWWCVFRCVVPVHTDTCSMVGRGFVPCTGHYYYILMYSIPLLSLQLHQYDGHGWVVKSFWFFQIFAWLS